jgi:hypothetical protein
MGKLGKNANNRKHNIIFFTQSEYKNPSGGKYRISPTFTDSVLGGKYGKRGNKMGGKIMIFIPCVTIFFPLRTCPIDNSLLLLIETNNSDGFHAHQGVIYTDFLNYTNKQFL